MIAVARNISYGAAYTEYAAKKDRAVFVGSQNMVGDFGLVFDNRQLDDIWLEFKEAGTDYVRKGKEVTRDLFVIESSPSSHESVNWSKQDWLDHAKELLEEIDKVSLKVPRKGSSMRMVRRNYFLYPRLSCITVSGWRCCTRIPRAGSCISISWLPVLLRMVD